MSLPLHPLHRGLSGLCVGAVGVLAVAGCAASPAPANTPSSGASAPSAHSASSGGAASTSASAVRTPSALKAPASASVPAGTKKASGLTLPKTVGDYHLATGANLGGMYQKSGSPTDAYIVTVTQTAVDVAELGTQLFGQSAKEIGRDVCGKLTSSPSSVCLRQLDGGYLQVTRVGAADVQAIAAFADQLYARA